MITPITYITYFQKRIDDGAWSSDVEDQLFNSIMHKRVEMGEQPSMVALVTDYIERNSVKNGTNHIY